MKKLRLDPDALVVESFDAVTVAADGGTVQGLAYTPGCDSIRICLPNDPSYDPCSPDSGELACTGSCQNTCYGGTCTTCT